MKPDLQVIGTGTVAQDLALWAVQCGLQVQLLSRSKDAALGARQRIEARLDRLGLALAAPQVRLRADTELEASWILEAVPENPLVKREIWGCLLQDAAPGSTLLSTTSSLPLTQLLPDHPRADEVLTFHPFVPMHRLRVVELAFRTGTSEVVLERARHLARRLSLQAVEVQDQAGLVASRMGLAQGLEAIRVVEAGVANVAAVDALMVKGYGHPVGPLELSDRVGLDVRLAIAEGLHGQGGNPVFEPPQLLRRLVAQGHLGRKTGMGFYVWNEEGDLHGNASHHTCRGRALRDPLAGL